MRPLARKPLLVAAVMAAVPTPVVETHPAVSTVAIIASLDDQVTGFATTAPVESTTVAKKRVMRLMPGTRPPATERGDTLTWAMPGGGGGGGASTVIAARPTWPSLVAAMDAPPAPIAVTAPPAETVATADALLVHATARPVRSAPVAS